MTDLENLILKEADYISRMGEEVKPYLNIRRQERWVNPSAPAKKTHLNGKLSFEDIRSALDRTRSRLEEARTSGEPNASDRAETSGEPNSSNQTENKNSKKLHLLSYWADAPKAAIIISHGFTEAEPKYHEMIYYFLRHQYNVYLPEHCGHGKSYRLTSDPSLVHIDHWERYVADFIKVSRLAKRENPNVPLFLYGHSMGGGIAAAAASLAPELYERVVLSSPMIRPLTGNLSWGKSALISHAKCLTFQGNHYLPGHKSYAGAEVFSESGGTSKPRFLHYDFLRQATTELQTCAASYSWLYESLRMSGYLLTQAYRRIQSPVLLLHPQEDDLVSVEAQEKFAKAMNQKGRVSCEIETFAEAKHELFNSGDDILKRYWERVFRFLE